MSIGKRFKKKMKNPKAGNSYWRIWGWPIKPENQTYFESKTDGVLVNGIWYQLFFETISGAHMKSYSGTNKTSRLGASVTGYYRTRTQAQKVLQEIADGKHKQAELLVRNYHSLFDDQDIWVHVA